jgi:hypothetical protein
MLIRGQRGGTMNMHEHVQGRGKRTGPEEYEWRDTIGRE